MRLVACLIWCGAVAASIAPLVGWNRYIYEVINYDKKAMYIGKPLQLKMKPKQVVSN